MGVVRRYVVVVGVVDVLEDFPEPAADADDTDATDAELADAAIEDITADTDAASEAFVCANPSG